MFALQSDIKPKTLLKINYNLVDIQTAVNEQLAFSSVLSYQKYWFFFLLSSDYLFSLENSFLNKKKKIFFMLVIAQGFLVLSQSSLLFSTRHIDMS